jgi:uncharacterized protein (DUF1800 family)
MNEALAALNRFGLGARMGERPRIADARGWLEAQLSGGGPVRPAPAGTSTAEISAAMRGYRAAAQGSERRAARQRLARIATAETRAALTQRVTTDEPFVERLVAFWSNHLCVAARAKVLVASLAGSYEREVIRPHVLGRFEEMVVASAKHPAMLLYLDNFQSVGPGSAGARPRRGGAGRGLNENYARELLELHTLGVDGGYSQDDVIALARILTGWTIGGFPAPGTPRRQRAESAGSGPIQFLFRDELHEPGPKVLLGERYEETGVEEGERAIRALCRHPSTASFVAGKLVAHFVSDQPPASAVERVARTFRDSGGDLRATAKALIDLPESWSAEARKFRTPQDWLVAVLRAIDAREANDNVAQALRQLRHPLWSPGSPKGFGDTAQEWADPDSLLNRAELARTMARRATGRRVDPRQLLEVVDDAGSDSLRALLSDTAIPAEERIALASAGPAFQWR